VSGAFFFKLIFLSSLLFLLNSCNRGMVLKIGDQDIFAFGTEDSCNFVQNAQGVRVSWKSAVPFHLLITSSVPPKYDSAILKAVNTWNARKGMTLIEAHRDNAAPNSVGSDGVNGIYWLTEWSSDQQNEQGRTSIKWDISKLKEVDIKINAKNFKFYTDTDSDKTGKISLESLILHELGHAMGLKHIEQSDSVMQPYLATGKDRNTPGNIDINSLNCEY